jgi:hypothetical protein
MNIKRLFAIAFIFACTAAGWFILGTSMLIRTGDRLGHLSGRVQEVWGPAMEQEQPEVFHFAPGSRSATVKLQPQASHVDVHLAYSPKKKGLFWHRTYDVEFRGSYTLRNPAPVQQILYITFKLPSKDSSYVNFTMQVEGDEPVVKTPREGVITQGLLLPPSGERIVRVGYSARGVDHWRYALGNEERIRNFSLSMKTNFEKIDFPSGTASPTTRTRTSHGWELEWNYPDVIGAAPIGMEMPKALNAGPTATRISFFAPVSLLFFFTVILMATLVKQVPLHPMNYFFLAAGFFAFPLLLAYLVDLIPLHLSFLISAAVSMVLVCGYLHVATRGALTLTAVISQAAYMVLFSYSFFFDGLTGLVITLGAIATLALLMIRTARIDWASRFTRKQASHLQKLPRFKDR